MSADSLVSPRPRGAGACAAFSRSPPPSASGASPIRRSCPWIAEDPGLDKSAPAPKSATRRLVLAYGFFGFGYVVTAAFVADMARSDPVLRPAGPFVWLCAGLAAAPSVALWTWAGAALGQRPRTRGPALGGLRFPETNRYR